MKWLRRVGHSIKKHWLLYTVGTMLVLGIAYGVLSVFMWNELNRSAETTAQDARRAVQESVQTLRDDSVSGDEKLSRLRSLDDTYDVSLCEPPAFIKWQ